MFEEPRELHPFHGAHAVHGLAITYFVLPPAVAGEDFTLVYATRRHGSDDTRDGSLDGDHRSVTALPCEAVPAEASTSRKQKQGGCFAVCTVMSTHFGVVVTDSNKRGENEALNEEEKRQMYAAPAAAATAAAETFCSCLDIETWLVQHASDVGASLQVLAPCFSASAAHF